MKDIGYTVQRYHKMNSQTKICFTKDNLSVCVRVNTPGVLEEKNRVMLK